MAPDIFLVPQDEVVPQVHERCIQRGVEVWRRSGRDKLRGMRTWPVGMEVVLVVAPGCC